jgi:hypothetical protein
VATKRKSISKKIRFEVFKRDSFKCQYCGASAPDVILEMDHIEPVSKDGADEMVNYITSCRSCNAGKSDRTLDDNTTLQKQRAQLAELNERREQLEMMLQWRKGLKGIAESEVESVCDAWREAVPGWRLNENGRKSALKYIKKHGVAKVLDAIDEVRTAYVKIDEEGKATQESMDLAWSKVGGFLRMAGLPDDERRLYYVKGILRNRLSYVPYDVLRTMSDALKAGVPVEDMELEAKHCRTWSSFESWLDEAAGW